MIWVIGFEALITVTFTMVVLSLLVLAVIRVSPKFLPVTLPLLSTVAIFPLLDDQETDLLVVSSGSTLDKI